MVYDGGLPKRYGQLPILELTLQTPIDSKYQTEVNSILFVNWADKEFCREIKSPHEKGHSCGTFLNFNSNDVEQEEWD